MGRAAAGLVALALVGCGSDGVTLPAAPGCSVTLLATPTYVPAWTACDPGWPVGCEALVLPDGAAAIGRGDWRDEGRFSLVWQEPDTTLVHTALLTSARTLVELRGPVAGCRVGEVGLGDGRGAYTVLEPAASAGADETVRVRVARLDELASPPTAAAFPEVGAGRVLELHVSDAAVALRTATAVFTWSADGSTASFAMAPGASPLVLAGHELFWVEEAFPFASVVRHATVAGAVLPPLYTPAPATQV